MYQHQSSRDDDISQIIPSTARSRLAQRMNLLRQQQQQQSLAIRESDSSSASSSPSSIPSPNRLPLKNTHRHNLPSLSAIQPDTNGGKESKKCSSRGSLSSSSSQDIQCLSDGSISPKKKPFARNDAAALVKHKLASIRQPTATSTSTSAMTNREVQQTHKIQGRKNRKSDQSITVSASSDSLTTSSRRVELRKFLDMERLKRKNEREMKDLLQRSIEGVDDDHEDDEGDVNIDTTETDVLVEDECQSDENLSMNEVERYEGPPEMDDDEPLYSTIRKKMTTTPRSAPGAKSSNISSCEPRSIDQRSAKVNAPKQNTIHTHTGLKIQEQSSLQSDVVLKNNPVKSRGEMFSFFVPIEYGQEPVAPEDQPVPLIHLGTFTESAWLEFGDERLNTVGEARFLPFDLHVPNESKLNCYQLQVERVPVKKGFSLGLVCDETSASVEKDDFDDSCTCFTMHKGQTKRLFVTWIPNAPGGVCETIYLKFTKGRVRVTVRGHARAKKGKKAEKKTTRSVSFALTNTGCTKDKKRYSYLPSPRHFISPNSERTWDKYNDRWAAQQDETYKIWLNHIFKSPDMHDSEHSTNVTLRAVLSQRRRVQATQYAQSYFRTPEVQWMRYTIDNEVHLKRLTIRTDHDVFANVNLRSQLISLLMSYTAPWLRIGLETIFGESISVETCKPRDADEEQNHYVKKETLTTILKRFIIERVLSDPFLKMKYTKGKCNIPSGRFERMYKNELSGHTLRKTLTLIIFLDGAKRNNVLPSSIRLFRKNGVIKSSKDCLHILCRDYIHGIGNLNKHLHQLGVSVSFEQSPLEELDFFVTNLATDLRDGVRLGKLAEALGNSSGVIEQMRIPAISRLQKVFNVGVALSALSDLGVPNVDQIHPNYIVDGHRPQVLKILWSITSSLELNNQLDKEKLREEIYNIRRSHNTLDGPVEFSSLCGDIESCQDICDLLLVWCDTVCSFYNVNVTNFSSSFADGRANNDVALLDDGKREQLFRNERNNCSLACQKIIEIGGIPNMLPISDTSNSPDERTIILCVGYLCKRLLESSKESSAISVIQNAVRLYLNRSKMGLKRNAVNVIERAWIAYRSLYFKRQRELYTKPVRIIEAFFIARRSVFERNSRQRFCAIQLQKVARGYMARKLYHRVISERRAIILIQKVVRGYMKRKTLEIFMKSLVIIQSFMRMALSQRQADLRFRSILKIQSACRKWLNTRKSVRIITGTIDCSMLDQTVPRLENKLIYSPGAKDDETFKQFQSQGEAEQFSIQSFWTSYISTGKDSNIIESEGNLIVADEKAAKLIQTAWRLHQKKKIKGFWCNYVSANIEERCAVVIQSTYRGYKSRANLSMRKYSAAIIQKWYKRQMQIKRKSVADFYATIIQANWRRFSATLQYRFDLSDIVFTQSLVRQRLAKARFSRSRHAIILLQSVVRRWLARKKRRIQVRLGSSSDTYKDHFIHSATILQKYWRRYVAYMDFQIYRNAATTLQRFVRSRNPEKTQNVIDDGYRSRSNNVYGHRCTPKHNYSQESSLDIDVNFAATQLQRIWRGYTIRLDFLLLLAAARRIQVFYRTKRALVLKNTDDCTEYNMSVKSEEIASITTLSTQGSKLSYWSNTTSATSDEGKRCKTLPSNSGNEDSPYNNSNLDVHHTERTYQSDVLHQNDDMVCFNSLSELGIEPSGAIEYVTKDIVDVDTSKDEKPKTVDIPHANDKKDELTSSTHKREMSQQSRPNAIKMSSNTSEDCPSLDNESQASGRVVPLSINEVMNKENVDVYRSKQQTSRGVFECTSDKKVQLSLPHRKAVTSKQSQEGAVKISNNASEDCPSVGNDCRISRCVDSSRGINVASTDVDRSKQQIPKAVLEESVDISLACDKSVVIALSPQKRTKSKHSVKDAVYLSSNLSACGVGLENYQLQHKGGHVSPRIVSSSVIVLDIHADRPRQQSPKTDLVETIVIPGAFGNEIQQMASYHERDWSKQLQEAAVILPSSSSTRRVGLEDIVSEDKAIEDFIKINVDADSPKEETPKVFVEETFDTPGTSDEKVIFPTSTQKRARSQQSQCASAKKDQLSSSTHKRVTSKQSQEAAFITSNDESENYISFDNGNHLLGRVVPSRVNHAMNNENDNGVRTKYMEETVDIPHANDKKDELTSSTHKREMSQQSRPNAIKMSSNTSEDCPSLDNESKASGRVVPLSINEVMNKENVDVYRSKYMEETIDISHTSDKRVQLPSFTKRRTRSQQSQEGAVITSNDASEDCPSVGNDSRVSTRVDSSRAIDVASKETTDVDKSKRRTPKAFVDETVDKRRTSDKKVPIALSTQKRSKSKQSQETIARASSNASACSVGSEDRKRYLSECIVSSRPADVASKDIIDVDRLKQHGLDSTNSEKLPRDVAASIKPSLTVEPKRYSTETSYSCDIDRTSTNISVDNGHSLNVREGCDFQKNTTSNLKHIASRRSSTPSSENASLLEKIGEGQEDEEKRHKLYSSRNQSKSTSFSSGKADHLLGPRTKEALQALKSCSSFQEVMKAMRILENATKLSFSSRKAFANAGAHSILYDLMLSCNRSAPHLELLECILGTLFHVSKHRDLVPYITTEASVDIFIDIIQLFRDKDVVFSTASMILKRIVWSDGKYLSQCRKKENMKRILGVYKLIKVEPHIRDGQSPNDHNRCRSGIHTLSRILEKCISREELEDKKINK